MARCWGTLYIPVMRPAAPHCAIRLGTFPSDIITIFIVQRRLAPLLFKGYLCGDYGNVGLHLPIILSPPFLSQSPDRENLVSRARILVFVLVRLFDYRAYTMF